MTLARAIAAARRLANRTGRQAFVVMRGGRPRATLRNPGIRWAWNPAEGRWVTLRGRRVELGPQGEIRRGIMRDAEGVDVRKLPKFFRARRRLLRPGICEPPRRKLRYPSAEAAFKWLLEANPPLVRLIEAEGSVGEYGGELAAERRRRKRAGLRQHGGQLGAIDDIAVYLDTTPARLGTLSNAIYRAIPRGRRADWQSFNEVFRNLLAPAIESQVGWDEMGGVKLQPPEPAVEAMAAEEEAARCALDVEQRVADLAGRYGPRRRRRRAPRALLEETPFN